MTAYDPSINPLNNTEWAFPLTEILHIGAMALSIGAIALVDLRLLGFGMRRQTAAQLVADTELWTLAGLGIAIVSGLLIFSSDPVPYLRNGPFLFKMSALPVGIAFNYTIHRMVATGAWGKSSSLAGKLVACVSLALWVSMVAAGIFLAFV
jgi:hypothetical protein